MTEAMPCLTAPERLTYNTARARHARGVDIGPSTGRALVAIIDRLALTLTAIEATAQTAAHKGGEVPPETLYALIGGPGPMDRSADG